MLFEQNHKNGKNQKKLEEIRTKGNLLKDLRYLYRTDFSIKSISCLVSHKDKLKFIAKLNIKIRMTKIINKLSVVSIDLRQHPLDMIQHPQICYNICILETSFG